jgi:hypothetical protein
VLIEKTGPLKRSGFFVFKQSRLFGFYGLLGALACWGSLVLGTLPKVKEVGCEDKHAETEDKPMNIILHEL